MDVAEQIEDYTIDDIYNLPEGQRAELIDGELYMLATPARKHQKLVGQLFLEISNYIRSNHGDCEVYPAPFSVFLNANNEIYLEPDISVVCDKDKLTDQGCNGAPDLVIEIVSPSSRSRDYYKKLLKYATAGVREYWIVDPEKKHSTVYRFEQDTVEEYSFMEQVKVGIFEDLEIDFSEIDME